jgi:hypothetical protein
MEDRVSVLGEFGGLGLPVEGHLWWDRRNWGYRTYTTRAELQSHYESLIHRLRRLVQRGLAAAVYTQTTDCEGEVNGLMTYDREPKMDAAWLTALHAPLYAKPVPLQTITLAPTSEEDGVIWRYTFEDPGRGWETPGFDETTWAEGPGGFGTKGTPGAQVRTTWDGNRIWLRRTFEAGALPEGVALLLRLHHDEDAEVYLNGTRIAELPGYATDYIDVPIDENGAAALRDGTNLLAIACKQSSGGQYIDAGLGYEIAGR